ncbi:MAG TPA: sigma-70 family RNA polymerase sigma factor [Solirubrobacterales bacterium]|nr:sigma-70 family RNA polymerase sigma factor [Solirubrobacterales bacterium]
MNDERLARRAAAGDRRAFETIFRRYHQDLYRFCLATVGNPEDAQDALQNTMVKALRALPGEQREIKLRPWLYRIARNESVEVMRRRRYSAELDPEQPAPIPEIAETAAARERLRDLLTDLETLPERQRTTLTMRELGGLDFAEIGAALETSAAVARQTLYEARLSLRQMKTGREMDCDAVTAALSDADGRVTRRRDIRAHLRNCAECRAFRDGIAKRRDEFASIAPLPLAASAALLQGLLGAGTAATSAFVKSAATVAIVAAVGVTAADRGGLIEVPLPGRENPDRVERVPVPPPAGAADGGAASATGEDRGAAGKARVGRRAAAVGLADRNGDRRGTGLRVNGGRGAGEALPGREQAAIPDARQSPKQGPGEPGRDEALSAASSQGQQTAAARKAPQANRSPGTPRSRGSKSPQGSSRSHARPTPSDAPPSRPEKPPQGAPPQATVPPDKSNPAPLEAEEPAAKPPAADKSKEAR